MIHSERKNRFANGIDMSCVTARQMQIILNLIEKLQKEIDELQSYIKEYLIPKSTINLLYVSKDKIREKIKEYDDFYKEYPIEFRKYKMRPITVVLKELLEEE